MPTVVATGLLPPGISRVVAIGDLHGDLSATLAALRLAGAVGAGQRWIGGRLVVVQTGDILDRGDEEEKIIKLLDRLRDEAARSGGALHLLMGNHEMMNFRGDFRYVGPGGFSGFLEMVKMEKMEKPRPGVLAQVPGKAAKWLVRASAFRPGGPLSKFFSPNPVVLTLGKVVFVHGGVLASHVRYGFSRINRETSAFVRGRAPFPQIMRGSEAPTWVRRFSGQSTKKMCRELSDVLKAARAEVMVVGHTIQKHGISSACTGKVWRIDTGMAAAYGSQKVSVLAITRDSITPLGGSK
ncbi:metallophosphoesterase [Myxococcota bacterium]|nr:metallophosphoesterase [Myxococcota bacterium]MBU1536048.1 metallophosphoesterase [Myxococcota bacterium]